jgi:hypothetical protein
MLLAGRLMALECAYQHGSHQGTYSTRSTHSADARTRADQAPHGVTN